jgi:RNA polymerase sigma-70 factor (ECF subfamily)
MRAEVLGGRSLAVRGREGTSRDSAIVRLATASAARGYRIARDLLGDSAEAEDAVQEALARACTGHAALRDPAMLEAWFLRVLTNHCLRTLRRRRWLRLWTQERSELAIDEAASPRADVELAAAAQHRWLLAAVAHLPPQQRAAIVLRYGHGMSINQVADALGVASGTIKTHLARGLQRLQALLGGGDR